jgi:putative membrane protein
MRVMSSKVAPFLAGVFAIFVVGTATAQRQPEYGKKPERTITANPSSNNPVKGVDETDQNFMKDAAMGNEAEIQLGQMAQSKASNPAVKSFGQRMVKDHSAADDKLKSIAESQHISLPVELDPKHKNQAEALSRLSGPQFDKAYMTLMVQEHTQDVNKFKKEAASSHDPTLQQFAQSTLPVLQSHLNEAQQVEQKVNNE